MILNYNYPLLFRMSQYLSAEEFEAIKNEFLELDRNKDGRISRSEIAKVFTKNDASLVNFQMTLMDLDSNGYIEFNEFLEMAAFWEYNKRICDWKIRRMFVALDQTNNGILSIDEIKSFCDMIYQINSERPSYEEVYKFVQELDKNGDGVIDCKEFIEGYDKFQKL